MRILLFGSTGMMGTAIETICKERGINYIGITHDECDVTNASLVREKIEFYLPDIVINAVAIIGDNPCESDPLLCFNINAISVAYMAKTCEKNQIIFVQPSSHAVFDGEKDDYYTENDLPIPLSMYSASKYMAEIFALNLCKKHYIVRFPTMFGERENKRLGFVDKVINKIMKGEELKIADDKIDSMTYSIDAAEQLVWMLEQKVPYGIYHIANEGKVSYYDFVKKFAELLKADIKLKRAKDSEFPSLGHKPLKTSMKSIKLPPIRNWEVALYDYVSKYQKRELP